MNSSSQKLITILIIIVGLLVVAGVGFYFFPKQSPYDAFTPPAAITPAPIPTPSSSSSTPILACAKAGCSGQLCVDAKLASEIVTTCEARPEYACYQQANCEVQTNGTCGWTQTQELRACVQSNSCGNPPDQAAPPQGCHYEGRLICENRSWKLPVLMCP